MPTVEGFTPSVLWTTLYGLIAICILFMVVFRVYEAIRTIIERRKQKAEASAPDFAEKVSKRVIQDMEPRLREIESNLERDKRRLENHEMLISDITESQKNIHDGMVAMCKFLLVLTTYGNLGNNEKIKEANAELARYLAEQM